MDKRSVDYFDFAKGAVRRILDLRSHMSALSPDSSNGFIQPDRGHRRDLMLTENFR